MNTAVNTVILSTRDILKGLKDRIERTMSYHQFDCFMERFFTVAQIEDFAPSRIRDLCQECAEQDKHLYILLCDLSNEVFMYLRDHDYYRLGMLTYGYSGLREDGSIIIDKIIELSDPSELTYENSLSYFVGQGRGI